MTRDEAAWREKSIAVLPSQVTTPYFTTSKSKKSLAMANKAYFETTKKSAMRTNRVQCDNPTNSLLSLPAEESTQVRMKLAAWVASIVPFNRVNTTEIQDPQKKYREVIKYPQVKFWEEAMRR